MWPRPCLPLAVQKLDDRLVLLMGEYCAGGGRLAGPGMGPALGLLYGAHRQQRRARCPELAHQLQCQVAQRAGPVADHFACNLDTVRPGQPESSAACAACKRSPAVCSGPRGGRRSHGCRRTGAGLRARSSPRRPRQQQQVAAASAAASGMQQQTAPSRGGGIPWEACPPRRQRALLRRLRPRGWPGRRRAAGTHPRASSRCRPGPAQQARGLVAIRTPCTMHGSGGKQHI